MVVALVGGCGTEAACVVGDLAESGYCGDGRACPTLDAMAQTCLVGHTEQDCVSGERTWTLVGGNDDSEAYYEGQALVAVRVMDEGEYVGCDGAWYGEDLSRCTPVGEPVEVPCDQGW